MPDLIKEFGTLAGLKAAQDARLASLPQKPEDYKLELPKDFKPPDGWVLDDKDPRLPALREAAKEAGIDQAAFSKLVAADAQARIAEHTRLNELAKAEQAKLGANGTARVTAVKTWLSSIVGPEVATFWLGDDKNMGLLPRAADIEGLEKLQRALSSNGAAGYSGSGRDNNPAPPPRSIAERIYPNHPSATARN
jgi:hypothetical protein